MTRDYVLQMQEIQRAVLAQAEATKSLWQDDVAKRYYGDYVDCYEKNINAYLRGGPEILGKGLEELLEFFEQKIAEMSQLTGCPNPNVGGGEIVHDSNLNRPGYMFTSNVPNPDYLDTETVHSIEKERTRNDERGYMESPFSSYDY